MRQLVRTNCVKHLLLELEWEQVTIAAAAATRFLVLPQLRQPSVHGAQQQWPSFPGLSPSAPVLHDLSLAPPVHHLCLQLIYTVHNEELSFLPI